MMSAFQLFMLHRVLSRHRDFVSQFEERVFRRFRLSGRYQEAREAGAEPLASKGAALQLLASLSAAAGDSEDEDAAAFLTPGNLLIMEAWDEAVVAKGLELDEYQALRALGDTAGCSSSQQRSARDALRQLASCLPEGFAACRQPLEKLLTLLAGGSA
ncbi:hypothetical protein TSOC_003341 [Tetrabaena socialis]|uniref:Uncharacterized protein n=1 Tax=Tetrabaena socialis TaxID=47790 RepID=A0A2J8ABW4_9CHLO|nr:hypothetical protein TSOC_003341 [Tetrabaena socialis]|eukprot:PNH09987.1 hypothetical protein TSOC_003341 [Tetrabaena socialis]